MMKLISSLQLHKRFILTLLLLAVFLWSLTSIHWNRELFHAGGIPTMLQIFEGLIQPNLAPSILLAGLESAWITLAYAVAGMSLAIVYAFIVGVLASGTLTTSKFSRFISKVFLEEYLVLLVPFMN